MLTPNKEYTLEEAIAEFPMCDVFAEITYNDKGIPERLFIKAVKESPEDLDDVAEYAIAHKPGRMFLIPTSCVDGVFDYDNILDAGVYRIC